MKILILDTSTERGLVAVGDQERILFVELLPFGLKSSKYLFPAIEGAMEAVSGELDGIAVTVGPGSFTGIRVGVSTAKGIAKGQNLPLIPLNSLEGFVSEKEGVFASLIDARIGGAYALLQENRGGKISTIGEEAFLAQEELKEFLKGVSIAVGPSLERLSLPCPVEEIYPDPEEMRKAAFRKWENGFSSRVTCHYFIGS